MVEDGERGEHVEAIAEETDDNNHHDDEGVHVDKHFAQEDWVDRRLPEQSQPVEEFEPHRHLTAEGLPNDQLRVHQCLAELGHDRGCEDQRHLQDLVRVDVVPLALVVLFQGVAKFGATAAFLVLDACRLALNEIGDVEQLLVGEVGP